jgi:hypothetical protein
MLFLPLIGVSCERVNKGDRSDSCGTNFILFGIIIFRLKEEYGFERGLAKDKERISHGKGFFWVSERVDGDRAALTYIKLKLKSMLVLSLRIKPCVYFSLGFEKVTRVVSTIINQFSCFIETGLKLVLC